MAPLPHNNTQIYYFDYSSILQNHTFEVRTAPSISPLAVGATIDSLLLAVSAMFYNITINACRSQNAGNNFSVPVISGIEGNVYGIVGGTVDSVPVALNFIGRSPGGRRVRLELFSYGGGLSTYRLTSAESTPVLNAIAILNGTAGTFQAIDGLDPVWYPYANVLVNAYWQRAVRA